MPQLKLINWTRVSDTEIKIIRQSHIGLEFGVDKDDSYRAKNGIILCAECSPQSSGHKDLVYVRGLMKEHDENHIKGSLEYIGRCEIAMMEYNDYFKTESDDVEVITSVDKTGVRQYKCLNCNENVFVKSNPEGLIVLCSDGCLRQYNRKRIKAYIDSLPVEDDPMTELAKKIESDANNDFSLEKWDWEVERMNFWGRCVATRYHWKKELHNVDLIYNGADKDLKEFDKRFPMPGEPIKKESETQ